MLHNMGALGMSALPRHLEHISLAVKVSMPRRSAFWHTAKERIAKAASSDEASLDPTLPWHATSCIGILLGEERWVDGQPQHVVRVRECSQGSTRALVQRPSGMAEDQMSRMEPVLSRRIRRWSEKGRLCAECRAIALRGQVAPANTCDGNHAHMAVWVVRDGRFANPVAPCDFCIAPRRTGRITTPLVLHAQRDDAGAHELHPMTFGSRWRLPSIARFMCRTRSATAANLRSSSARRPTQRVAASACCRGRHAGEHCGEVIYPFRSGAADRDLRIVCAGVSEWSTLTPLFPACHDIVASAAVLGSTSASRRPQGARQRNRALRIAILLRLRVRVAVRSVVLWKLIPSNGSEAWLNNHKKESFRDSENG